MYTPALISMIWHTLASGDSIQGRKGESLERVGVRADRDCTTSKDVANFFRVLTKGVRLDQFRTIPVAAVTRQLPATGEYLGRRLESADVGEFLGQAFWGRFTLNRLLRHFDSRHWVEPDEEYVDFGTPLKYSATSPATAATNLQTLLDLTDEVSPDVWIGLVDEGTGGGGAPSHYNHKLSHAAQSAGDLSQHAQNMLRTILERVDSEHGCLDRIGVMCSLVKAPTLKGIGPECFEHDNVTELLSATNALRKKMGSRSPSCINMSLGTHVGPHNGVSPLEDAVDALASTADWYVTSSSGNDGQRGVAASRHLTADLPDDLVLRTSGQGARELLIEFWWRHDPAATISIEVMARDATGRDLYSMPMKISTQAVTSKLKTADPAYSFRVPANKKTGRVTPSSLCHAVCRNDMSCAAYAISAKSRHDLADIDLAFRLLSDTDRTVNCWVTVCDDPRTTFVAGSSSTTMTVPSTLPSVVAVAGVVGDGNGTPWADSSRGPVEPYDAPARGVAQPGAVPDLSHVVDSGRSTGHGTSYASARTCADAAALLLANLSQLPIGADALSQGVLRQQGITPTATQHPRTGYGSVVR